jgi:uncharacterized phage protein (TIGR02220 family)
MPPEKGQYRSIYSCIWDDPEFQSFDPVTQLVFFNLRTSRDCNFPCIFTFYQTTLYERMKTSEPSDIDAGLDALIAAGWVRYERPVIWIVKGLRNEPSFVPANSKQMCGIANALRTLPKLAIVQEFAEYYEIPMDAKASKKAPKEKLPPKQDERELEDIIPAKDIIEYLNEKTGKKFSATSRATRRHIAARWKEGFGIEEFRKVIDHQVAKWVGDPKMEEYLRPETLFGTKFESYLNAPPLGSGVTRGTDTAGRELEELR